MACPLPERFLRAFDRLDAEACAALFTDAGDVREYLLDHFGDLRSVEHVVREQWQVGNVWIAEVDARYVLADHSRHGPISKMFVMRMNGDRIEDLRIYAAGEHSFHEAAVRHENERSRGFSVGGRWTPPL